MKSVNLFIRNFFLILVLVALNAVKPVLADTTSWTDTESLAVGRYSHTATLLPNGQVLVVGGGTANAITSAELYNPATSSWMGTGPLTWGRYNHTATLLANGQVLVVGGYPNDYNPDLGFPNQ